MRAACVSMTFFFIMLCNKAVTVSVITAKHYSNNAAKRRCNYCIQDNYYRLLRHKAAECTWKQNIQTVPELRGNTSNRCYSRLIHIKTQKTLKRIHWKLSYINNDTSYETLMWLAFVVVATNVFHMQDFTTRINSEKWPNVIFYKQRWHKTLFELKQAASDKTRTSENKIRWYAVQLCSSMAFN